HSSSVRASMRRNEMRQTRWCSVTRNACVSVGAIRTEDEEIRVEALALRCIRCGLETGPGGPFLGCPRCDGEGKPTNMQVVYDDEKFLPVVHAIGRSSSNPQSMWHYRDLLPIAQENIVTIGEGGTPLIPAPRLGAQLGIPRL